MERMTQFARTLPVHAAQVAAGSHTENRPGGRAASIVALLAACPLRRAPGVVVLIALMGVLVGLCGMAERADAHEIPTDVVIQTYLKPAAGEVTLVMRVPLEAMRDVTFPQRGPGYINISEAEPYLNVMPPKSG